MPKLKKAYDPWERYRGAVLGRMVVLDSLNRLERKDGDYGEL